MRRRERLVVAAVVLGLLALWEALVRIGRIDPGLAPAHLLDRGIGATSVAEVPLAAHRFFADSEDISQHLPVQEFHVELPIRPLVHEEMNPVIAFHRDADAHPGRVRTAPDASQRVEIPALLHLECRAGACQEPCRVDTVNQAAPPGGLVQTPPQNSWMSEPQRFAVRLDFDPPDSLPRGVRLGSQATVMVYTEEAPWLRPVWGLFIRIRALISYVY